MCKFYYEVFAKRWAIQAAIGFIVPYIRRCRFGLLFMGVKRNTDRNDDPDRIKLSRHVSIYTNTSWTFFLLIFDGGRVPPNGEKGLWSDPSGLPTGGRHICLLNFFTSTVFPVEVSFGGVWMGNECCARMGAGFMLDALFTWERSCNDFLISLSSLRVKSKIKNLNSNTIVNWHEVNCQCLSSSII